MVAPNADHMRKHVKVYKITFVALAILTIITVALASIKTTIVVGIILALIIATIKVSLVATNFMHLIGEKPIIFAILIVTVVFLITMLALPLLHYYDPVTIN
jgi:cytochrome c oxidase subunit 4